MATFLVPTEAIHQIIAGIFNVTGKGRHDLQELIELLALPQIDLLLAAELLVVLLLVATMDATSPRAEAAEPALEEPDLSVQWTAETDLHAQRILRLEGRRTAGPASLR